VKALEVVPHATDAAEADHVEALPELPAQLDLDLRHLLALVAHDRRSAQADERPQVEGRVAEGRRGVPAYAEIERCAPAARIASR
jgi:hypothetical protein